MTNKMYLKLNFIISAFRDRETFTSSDVSTAMGWTRGTASTKVRFLEEIGAVVRKGIDDDDLRIILYAITPRADACLDSYYGMAGNHIDPDDSVFDQYPKLNFTGGVVVKKANVKGLGNAFFKRFDSLVMGVRYGMPAMR